MKYSELETLINDKVDTVKKSFKTRFIQADDEGKASLCTLISKKADKDEVREIQNANDDIMITATVLGKDPRELKIYKSFVSKIEKNNSELFKAMTTGGSTTGAEWIPTGYSNQLMMKIENERKVAALFPTIQMPQNPYIFPVQGAYATAYKIAENAAITESTPGTSNVTFTAAKLAVHTQVTSEMEEDSIVSILPYLKDEMAKALARGEENALINGCADNTIDSDNTTASDQRRVFVGLRKLLIANSYKTDIGTFNADTVGALRAKMTVNYAPDKCVWICGVSVWEQLSRLKDASGNPLVMTLDKFGANATLVKGVIGYLFGSPVILSDWMRETLNTNGVYDASTTTKAALILVRPDAFKIGYRGSVIVESQRVVDYQYTKLVTSMRLAFNPMLAIASNKLGWYGYNITA